MAGFADTMRQRWKPNWSPDLKNALELALNTEAAIADRRREIEAEGKLNARGIADALSTFVDKSAKPNLGHVKRAIEKAKGDIATRRLNLSPKKPSDPTAYLEQQEIRTWLRSLDKGGLMKALESDGADPAVLSAALTSPIPIPALDADMRVRVVERCLGSEFVRAEAEDKEAIATAEAALRFAEMAIATAAATEKVA